MSPRVTICALAYGNYPALIQRLLHSIRQNCERSEYALVVGANAVCDETLSVLRAGLEAGELDRLVASDTNLGKSKMMRRMFPHVRTEYIWWFDDDSYLREPSALRRWLRAASASPSPTVLWGQAAWCEHSTEFTDLEDVVLFVRTASWYRGLPPPSWRPGGKGEFNYRGRNLGDGRWSFILGGCFMIRTSAVHALNWPDPRLFVRGEDVFLGEAIRQHGWNFGNIGLLGVALNTEPSRGERK